MLFRPSFCCHCGEKIERAAWNLFTSRRFCQLCETDFVLLEYGSKAIAVLALIVAAVGIGSYFKGEPNKNNSALARVPEVRANRPPQNANANTSVDSVTAPNADHTSAQTVPANQQKVPRAFAGSLPRSPAELKTDTDGPYYYCGAATKKGTPCMRRVKGNIRCWQHVGQPPMLPPDKLRAAR